MSNKDSLSTSWDVIQATEPYTSEFNHFESLPNVGSASWLNGLDASIARAADRDYSNSSFKDEEIVCLPVLIHRTVTAPLVSQISIVNQSLLDYFMVDVEMEAHFRIFHSLVLLQDGEFSRCLTDELFEKLSNSRDATELLNPVYLNNVLHKATSQSLMGDTARTRNISFLLKTSPTTRESDVLNSLELTYKVDWPVNVVISESCLKQYGRLFKFMMLIKRTHWVIKDVFHRLKRATTIHANAQSPEMRALHLYRHEMEHFVKVLQEYVANQVVHVSWHEFLAELHDKTGSVRSLDDLIQCHTRYLTKCTSRCLLNKKAAPVMKIICDVFERIVIFSKQLATYDWMNGVESRSGGAVQRVETTMDVRVGQRGLLGFPQLRATYQTFHDNSTFLFKVVTSLAARGYEAHLDELLLRLNFNAFYMSDDRAKEIIRKRI